MSHFEFHTLIQQRHRFYQEVGRGGRDGKACISLTLYTNKDLEIAKDLNDNSAITVDKGLQRWLVILNSIENQMLT